MLRAYTSKHRLHADELPFLAAKRRSTISKLVVRADEVRRSDRATDRESQEHAANSSTNVRVSCQENPVRTATRMALYFAGASVLVSAILFYQLLTAEDTPRDARPSESEASPFPRNAPVASLEPPPAPSSPSEVSKTSATPRAVSSTRRSKPECTSDADCPPSESCQDSVCAERPECTVDSDCRGPRQADCLVVTCGDDRKCHFDDTACGCSTSEDCFDGDPCTRDHCFVNTRSCIFIPQDCETE